MKKQNYSKENKILAESLEKEFRYRFKHAIKVYQDRIYPLKGSYKLLLILDLMIVWINVFAYLTDMMHSILDDEKKFKKHIKKQEGK